MKQIFIALALMLCVTSFAQSNEQIAGVYIKKSQISLENFKFQESLDHFNKAMKYLDTITKPSVARLGMSINYEMENFYESKKYAKQFFNLEKNETSEEYQDALELYVEVEEKIVALEKAEAEEMRIRLAKEQELRRIDSLKTVWTKKSKSLTFEADSIYAFNKNNSAIFSLGGKYGVVNTQGEVTIKPDYANFLSFDGYIIFTDKLQNPTTLFVYNIENGDWQKVPPVMDFNSISSHYGKVTLPRSNGRLVMYPNNATNSMVYDIEAKKFVRIANLKDLLKSLKKNDRIDKYDDDERTVKINRKWYGFGSHLGEGVYTLYNNETKKLYGYLITKTDSEEPVVLSVAKYVNLGVFQNGKAQAFKGINDYVWVNATGSEVSAPKSKSGEYAGNVKIEKISEGRYHFKENGFIIKGNEKLGKMGDFLRENSPNSGQ